MRSKLVKPRKETKKERKLRLSLIKSMLKDGKTRLKQYGIEL